VRRKRVISVALMFGAMMFLWSGFLAPAIAQGEIEEYEASSPGSEDKDAPSVPMTAELQTACNSAKASAKENHSSTGYMVGGFLCGVFGFALALMSKPDPPAEALLGKSGDYVLIYTNCYQEVAKKKNVSASCSGWVAGAAVALLIQSSSSSS
jgi:hypothetical protein